MKHDHGSISTIVLMLISLSTTAGGSIQASSADFLPNPVTPMKDLDLTRSRPLQEVVYQIEKRLQAPIGYEQGSPQEVDMQVLGATLGGRFKKDRKYTKMEHLQVHFSKDEIDPVSAIKTAMLAYDDGTPSHKFSVQQDGAMLLVSPAEGSVSMRKISVTEGLRDLDSTAQVIANAITNVAGREVRVWTPPFGDSRLYKFSADNQTVAEVLISYTRLLGGNGSYWLIYDPTSDCFMLSLSFIQARPLPRSLQIMPLGNNALEMAPVRNSPYFKKDKP